MIRARSATIPSCRVARSVVVGLSVSEGLAIYAVTILDRHGFQLALLDLNLAAQFFLSAKLINFIIRAHRLLMVRMHRW